MASTSADAGGERPPKKEKKDKKDKRERKEAKEERKRRRREERGGSSGEDSGAPHRSMPSRKRTQETCGWATRAPKCPSLHIVPALPHIRFVGLLRFLIDQGFLVICPFPLRLPPYVQMPSGRERAL